MSLSKIQKDALSALQSATAMLAKAQEQLRLADRFAVEPDPFTVIQFDKEFPNASAALEAAGLNFDPAKLVSALRPAGLSRLAEVVGRQSAGVLVLDEDVFTEAQRTSYRYVAIRIGDLWYTTAARNNKTMPWTQLIEFIGDSPCWVVESWREIPVVPPEVIEAAVADEGAQDTAVPTEEATLAEVLGSNRAEVMNVLKALRNNGKNPTPKTIVDALAKIGTEEK
jgi:hypothetical protein